MAARKLAAWIALALGTLGPAVYGQQDPLKPPDLDQYLRWGVVRARPRLQFRQVGYESNIFYAPEGSGPLVGDFVATVAPGLAGLVLFGDRAFLEFDAELPYKAYAQIPELNYLDRLGSARVMFPFGRMGVFGGLRATRIRLQPVDFDDIRTQQKLNEVNLGGVIKLGGKSYLEYTRIRQDYRYSDPDFGPTTGTNTIAITLDREEVGNRFDFTHRVRGRTTLGLALSNRAVRFDYPQVPTNGVLGPNRNAREIRLVPGIRLDIGGPLVGTLSVGWAELVHNYESPELPDYSGTVGEAALTYLFSGRSRIRIEAEKKVGFSAWEANNYYVLTDFGLGGTYYFSRMIGGEIGASRGRLSIPGTARLDHLTGGFVGVRFRMMQNAMGRRVEYAVRLRTDRRESNVPQFNRTNNWFSIDAIVGF